MTKTRVIKKYPNRRLYDTDISSYITIEDVRQLIVDGEDFEVRDAKSGDDLTRQVLLQIIAEHEQDGQPMLSTTRQAPPASPRCSIRMPPSLRSSTSRS